jgi:hypothetical protein
MNLASAWIAVGALAFGFSASPAAADDCAAVTAAMMATARTPYSSTISGLDAQGRTAISHMVQTPTTKYVETNGRWVAMKVSSDDLIDTLNRALKTTKMSCQRGGTETIGGQPTTIYMVHAENDGVASDNTLWISARNLPLKSDMRVAGKHYVSVYNYDNVRPPQDAVPAGGR